MKAFTSRISDEQKTGGRVLNGDVSLARSGMHTSRPITNRELSRFHLRTASWPVQ